MIINKSEYNAPIQNNAKSVNGNRPGERISDSPEQVVRFQIEEILKSVRTGMPGIVQKSFERQGAVWLEIQPALSGKKRPELGGEEIQLPIVRAPLGVISLGGFKINLPTPVFGDEVWIVCADRSIQTFAKEGGVGVPETVSIMTLNNAYALPFSTSNIKRKRVGDPENITITNSAEGTSSSITIKQDGSVEVENTKGKALLDESGNILLSSLTGTLTLATIDAALWQPNILPNCLFTGAPHGGSAGGINNLKGGTSS